MYILTGGDVAKSGEVWDLTYEEAYEWLMLKRYENYLNEPEQ